MNLIRLYSHITSLTKTEKVARNSNLDGQTLAARKGSRDESPWPITSFVKWQRHRVKMGADKISAALQLLLAATGTAFPRIRAISGPAANSANGCRNINQIKEPLLPRRVHPTQQITG
jgi:hypothetical protein